ncbi:hypothetical protein [Streptomyces sp. Tue6028]|uniref:hypothetical protein n=1 Tax=Streptomyces sp. Tue6028 TaxID=2036037 RepID=UPI003EBA7AEF
MLRDKALWFVTALAALLVVWQFLGVMMLGTSGYTTDVPATASLDRSTSVLVADCADELATADDVVQIVDSTFFWSAGRERHRSAAGPSSSDVPGCEFTTVPSGSPTSSYLGSRPSGTRSLASLQVFRC